MTDIKQEIIDGCKITYKKDKAESLKLFIQLLKNAKTREQGQEVS